MTPRHRQSNHAAKKQGLLEMNASIVEPSIGLVSSGKPVAGAPLDKQSDDHRAIRRSQIPAKNMSAVREHKYQVGQVVDFTPGTAPLRTSLGLYEIVRQLPPQGSENQYRVRNVRDGHERVVRENQLTKLPET